MILNNMYVRKVYHTLPSRCLRPLKSNRLPIRYVVNLFKSNFDENLGPSSYSKTFTCVLLDHKMSH